ncbi:MAG: hypothetical protein ACQESE_03185, partial [Nanobdellota archaeon]
MTADVKARKLVFMLALGLAMLLLSTVVFAQITELTVYDPSDTAWFNGSSPIHFNFTSASDSDDFYTCNLSVDDTSVRSRTVENNTLSNFTEDISEGSHYWSVWCEDSESQVQSMPRSLYVDSTPPEVNLEFPENSYNTTSASINFMYNVTDNLASQMNCSVYVDGDLNQTHSGVSNGSNQTAHIDGFEEGRHNWSVSCIDNVENTGTSSVNDFTVDSTPPDVNLESPGDSYNTSSTAVELWFNVTDNVAEDVDCEVYLDGDLNTTMMVSEGNSTFHNVTGLPEGHHSWNVSCDDDVSNVGMSSNRSFIVDTTDPQVTLNGPEDDFNTSSSDIDFNFTVTDNLATSLSCDLFIDDSKSNSDSHVVNDTSTVLSSSGIGDGSHYWDVFCVDRADNEDWSIAQDFTVDTTPPTITILDEPERYISVDYFDVNFTSSDEYFPPMLCDLSVDGIMNDSNGTVINDTETTLGASGLSEGEREWSLNCSDTLGNEGTYSTTTTVDFSAPDVSLDFPSHNGVITPSDSFNFSFVESSPVDCSLYVNGHQNQTDSYGADNSSGSFSASSFSDGSYTWWVRCVDTHGHSADSNARDVLVDNKGPDIRVTSPDDNHFITNDNNETTFTFSAVDDKSQLENCSLYFNNTLNQTNTTANNSDEISFTVKNISQGTHKWSVECSDTKGFKSSTSEYTLYNDNTDPQFEYVDAPSIVAINNSVDFDLRVYDRFAAEVDCDLLIDGSSVQPFTIPADNSSQSVSHTFDSGGVYNWSFTCQDGGQNSQTSDNYEIKIDAQPPTIINSSPQEGAVFENAATVEFSVELEDDYSSLNRMNCSFFINGQRTGVNSSDNAGLVAYSHRFGDDDAYNWSATCYDTVGNERDVASKQFVIDVGPDDPKIRDLGGAVASESISVVGMTDTIFATEPLEMMTAVVTNASGSSRSFNTTDKYMTSHEGTVDVDGANTAGDIVYVNYTSQADDLVDSTRFIAFSFHNKSDYRFYNITGVLDSGDYLEVNISSSLPSDLPSYSGDGYIFDRPKPSGWFNITPVDLFSGYNELSVFGKRDGVNGDTLTTEVYYDDRAPRFNLSDFGQVSSDGTRITDLSSPLLFNATDDYMLNVSTVLVTFSNSSHNFSYALDGSEYMDGNSSYTDESYHYNITFDWIDGGALFNFTPELSEGVYNVTLSINDSFDHVETHDIDNFTVKTVVDPVANLTMHNDSTTYDNEINVTW